jgi:outer membrane lipoprotein-sorting protein
MMNRRQFMAIAAAAGSGLALAGASRVARADEVKDTLDEITRARVSLKTLVGSFTQERTIGLLATSVKSEGEMTLVRPDRLRWELKAPDAITYWIAPEGFAFATKSGGGGVGKGAAGRFGAVLADMMILLGGDLESLRARYDLSIPSRKEGVVLLARPKADDVKKYVTSLEMSSGPELWTVKRIAIEEKNGDRSVITFGKLERDVKVDPARMKPPAK